MNNIDTSPLLTIAIPTYNRVNLLKRCLESIAGPHSGNEVELIVSDNSTQSDTEQFILQYARQWGRSLRYFRNPDGTTATQNFNFCYERARGRYTLILHDDDYLLPGAIDKILDVIHNADDQRDQVLLFGVRVEELSGRVVRRQQARSDTFLPPPEALYRLLGDSSFVRAPGLIVRTDAYVAVGGFHASAETADDFDIEVRLFARCGVRLLKAMTAAYTVHAGGETSSVFNARTVALSAEIFNHARQLGILDEATVAQRQRDWYYQFILGGTWRALRRGDRGTARQVLSLFQLPNIKALGVSRRWLLVRLVFSVLAGRNGRAAGASRDRDGDASVAR